MRTHSMRLSTAAAAAAFLCAATAHAAPISGQGTWESTLQERDINADGTVDAYYDITLGITWLATAMGTLGTPYDDGSDTADGRSSWTAAHDWAASLDVHGVTDWRLPQFLSPGNSEISHMHCVTLGNTTPGGSGCNPGLPPHNFVNSGPFANLSNNWVWLDETWTSQTDDGAWVWAGGAIGGYHDPSDIHPLAAHATAWAVRDGDVPAIPEPGTWALMLMGLGALGFMRRRTAKPE